MEKRVAQTIDPPPQLSMYIIQGRCIYDLYHFAQVAERGRFSAYPNPKIEMHLYCTEFAWHIGS